MIRFYKEGIAKNIVPLILCISIVTSCMYVYSREYLALFTLITIVIQASVFSFYTYISKKSMLLRFISILGSFFAIGGLVSIAIKTGNNKSTVDYFVWFLSPQSLVEFSPAYVGATFIIINFFIASTVYYFSAVRYRISMTFLITLIPFAVYRKESEQVPMFFALLLLVMYMALMIYCRQINTKPRQKIVVEKGYKRSMALFLALSSLLALVVPKPELDIDNSWVDTVFESEKFTEYMLHRLGIVSETASSSLNYSSNVKMKLFEFRVYEEPLNLKSQTYSLYNFEKNLWRTTDTEITGKPIDDTPSGVLDPSEFYKATAKAAELDDDFAEKYGISGIAPELSESYLRSVELVSSRVTSRLCYSPVMVASASASYSQRGKMYRTPQGMIYSENPSNQMYRLNYYSDRSVYEKGMQSLLKSLNNENFGDFLDDLYNVLERNGINDFDEVLTAYVNDFESALQYREETQTDMPESIVQITENIIKKRYSDYEKAMAIEEYFRNNDYVYSLSYKKPDGYNMEYFLTEGKTGICSDYATAMVLMARSVGIPARYAEGIHLHDPYEVTESSLPAMFVSVTDSDLHAFPELYISGYGWKSFEPTQLNAEKTTSTFDYRMSVVLALVSLLIIVFILFFDRYIKPYFAEKLFFSRLGKASNERSVSMIVSRIREKLGLDASATSAETGRCAAGLYGTDMTDLIADFDAAVYGGAKISDDSRTKAVEFYNRLMEIIKEENNKKKKFAKKGKA